MSKVTLEQSRRSYIATEEFTGDFFSYVVTKVKFNTVGTLSAVTSNTALCPAGRVLRETGRKLSPGINPGVTTYMVGVYDNQSGLSGFIDPNSPVFAVYSGDRPNFLVNNVDPGNGAVGGTPRLTDRGAPVLTNGLISAATTVSAGLSVTAGTTVTAGTGFIATTGQVRAANVVTLSTTSNSLTIDPTAGQVFKISGNQNFTIESPNPNNIPGAVIYLIITNIAGGNISVSFGTNGFRSAGATGPGAGSTYVYTFVSDGTKFNEICRSNGLSA